MLNSEGSKCFVYPPFRSWTLARNPTYNCTIAKSCELGFEATKRVSPRHLTVSCLSRFVVLILTPGGVSTQVNGEEKNSSPRYIAPELTHVGSISIQHGRREISFQHKVVRFLAGRITRRPYDRI